MMGTVHFETASGRIIRPYEDYGIYLKSYDAPLPDAKTYYEELDGRDGVIDLTEWAGFVNFAERNVTIELRDMNNNYRQLMQDIAGRALKIRFSDEPGYYYEGRCDSIDRTVTSRVNDFTLDFTCQPWRKRNTLTKLGSYDLVAETPVELTLRAERMPVCPIITVTGDNFANISDADGNLIYENVVGTFTLSKIVLTDTPADYSFEWPGGTVGQNPTAFTLQWRDGVL